MTRATTRPAARRATTDRGDVSIMVVLMVTIVIGGASVIFDGALKLIAERHASNVAEGAARAAVDSGVATGGLSAITARRAAIDHAAALGVPAERVVVSFPTPTTVLVTITQPVDPVFTGSLFNDARAEGRARWEYG
jgi:hypothetical protein